MINSSPSSKQQDTTKQNTPQAYSHMNGVCCILTCSRWLWHQIHWKRTCTTPSHNVRRTLHNIPRLDWIHLPGTNTKLGLPKWHCQYLNAKICRKGTTAIPTYGTNKTTACSAYMDTTPVWSNHTTHGTNWLLSKPGQSTNKTTTKNIGVFLYYGRALTLTMLVALRSLAAAQSEGTQATIKACTHLLNYAATHPEAVLWYKASDMILNIHSDASYLSETKVRSRAGGIFYLSNNSKNPPLNGAIHVHSSIMHSVLTSAMEAEVGALFYNAQELWYAPHLKNLGIHSQQHQYKLTMKLQMALSMTE